MRETAVRETIAMILAGVFLGASSAVGADNWPQWRGPAATGASAETGLPVRWSETENVAWKLAMPARSGSTPIIWERHVFLSVGDGDELWLWAVDRDRGEVLWKSRLGAENVLTRKQNMSSPSPVTDGERVWVLTGTGVVKAFDFAGKELWARNLVADHGKFGLNWGYASSPLLLDDLLVVQVLHGMKTDDPSYVIALDGVTGETRWHVERPTDAKAESPDAYTTPARLETAAGTQIVVSGGNYVTGHDPKTGRELWRGGGLNPSDAPMYRVVASPVVSGDLIFVPSRVSPFLVYRAGGSGDVTASHLAWSLERGPDVPTPATDGEHLYVLRDQGTISCYRVETGEPVWVDQRVAPGTYSASPVIADGKVYVTNEEGLTTVMRAGPEFEVLAENRLDGYTLSSIAVSHGRLFLRTEHSLYCLRDQSAPSGGSAR
ncbi:MAG TPA: PQQ-binding-like beta-propeller repeat protein [Thermoanaerobaculia bacterium]|nr:PQQ-binding-like beta-propeller repeat protein [Thermoanaerobaculia bacterium]